MRKINAICVIIAMVVVLFVGCGGSDTLAPQPGETGSIVIKYDKTEDSNFVDSSYSDIEDLDLDYISNSISEHGGDFDHGRFRTGFYNLPIQFVELVGRDVYRAWHRARCAEEFLNEHVAVSFIRYFNISREDFERANYEMYRQREELRHGPWAGIYPSPVDSSSFDLYPVDLIFSFDNERINEFFRWENSPWPGERGVAVLPKRVINSAAINVELPIVGARAEQGQPPIDWDLNYVVRSINWSPDIMPFAENTTYTVTVIISARTGYTLNGLQSATINGRPAVISNNTGITARISYTFSEGGGNRVPTPMIAAGTGHTVALRYDGTVLAWGNNMSGALGDGTTIRRSVPVQVQNLTEVIAVSAGNNFTVALKSDGTVWTWGNNSQGQLGDGTTNHHLTPMQVQNLTDIIAVSATSGRTVALRADGTIWTWGSNAHGQLGDGTTTNRHTPVQVQNLTNIIAISASSTHTVALREDGTVWAWGSNLRGQLGDGTTIDRFTPVQVQNLTDVVAISAGALSTTGHTVALRAGDTAWAWGNNAFGTLGDGTTTHRHVPVQVRNLTNLTAIAASSNHTFALREDGTVWAWGQSTTWGRLGDGTTINRSTPVQVQNLANAIAVDSIQDHAVSLREDGTVWTWGSNASGQLGDASGVRSYIPVQVWGVNGHGFLNLKESETMPFMRFFAQLEPVAAVVYCEWGWCGAFNFLWCHETNERVQLYRIQLMANVYPIGVDQTVLWNSSNPEIATVDQTGLVQRVSSSGYTTITATTENGVVGTFNVQVNDMWSIFNDICCFVCFPGLFDEF